MIVPVFDVILVEIVGGFKANITSPINTISIRNSTIRVMFVYVIILFSLLVFI